MFGLFIVSVVFSYCFYFEIYQTTIEYNISNTYDHQILLDLNIMPYYFLHISFLNNKTLKVEMRAPV